MSGDLNAAPPANVTPPSAVLNGGGDKAVTPDFINRFDEGVRPYVQNKGWKSEVDLLTSYQKLESQIGADKIVLPKDGDAESLKAFRAKLGVPETPDKYDVKLQDGSPVSEDFLKAAKAWFHEANLPPKQVQAIVDKYQAFVAESQKAADGTKIGKIEGERDATFKEWGKDLDQNKAAMQRAYQLFKTESGMSDADYDAMADAMGMGKVMKMFAKIGNMVGEHNFVGGDHRAMGFTPEAAKARMDALKADREWFARFAKGDAAAQAEWKNLQEAMARGLAA